MPNHSKPVSCFSSPFIAMHIAAKYHAKSKLCQLVAPYSIICVADFIWYSSTHLYQEEITKLIKFVEQASGIDLDAQLDFCLSLAWKLLIFLNLCRQCYWVDRGRNNYEWPFAGRAASVIKPIASSLSFPSFNQKLQLVCSYNSVSLICARIITKKYP